MSMDEMRNDEGGLDKVDEVMLPGFRFHPTDEELVGFYLKRKIQHRPLSIELIKQLDIYKYDPWDLPKLATTGEKEWYFYCPRDRKYRNSARPNRVTGAGFWKATGTDRPIYSSEGGSKCIGLKKSLVFYKGRAAKGIKTDWMMHEFRLPTLADSVPPKRFIDKNNIPANDSWAICRIFKKANSNAQRALSHSWVSPVLPDHTTTNVTSDILTSAATTNTNANNADHFSSDITKPLSSLLQYASCSNYFNDLHNSSSITNLSPHLFDLPPYKPYNQMPHSTPYTVLSQETTDHHHQPSTNSLVFNMSCSSILGDHFDKVSECNLDQYKGGIIQDQFINNGTFLINLPQVEQQINVVGHGGETTMMKEQCSNVAFFDDQWGINIRSSSNVGFPYTLPMSGMTDVWKSNLVCDSSSPCPSDQMSTSYSTNKCNA